MPNDEPTDEDRAALTAHRETMAQQVTVAIDDLSRLADKAEARDDLEMATKLRGKLPNLERKREEILNGQR